MKSRTDILVVGGGISGCAAAQELQEGGRDYLVIEKNAEPGGLTRSIDIGEAQFDYTGHYLHLSRYQTPAGIPYAHQDDADWQLIERHAAVFVSGTVVPAPFQYSLFSLPMPVRDRCFADYIERPRINPPTSFKEYLLSGFGAGMCEEFLFPYNEKLLAADLENLSVDNVKRFFPIPDKEKIERGYTQEVRGPSVGYNSFFWYPLRGGIGVLARGLADGLRSIETCCPLESIDLKEKVALTSLGSIRYDKIITSMPLNEFCSRSSDERLRRLATRLSHTRVLCLNLLFHGKFHEKFQGCHWIYVPDRSIPFYRVGIYSHIPNSVFRENRTALYVERAYSSTNASAVSLEQEIREALAPLERLGWVRGRDCILVSAHWIDCAYVHFDHARLETLDSIGQILANFDVQMIGRYGLWDYISMEDSICSGLEAARRMLG